MSLDDINKKLDMLVEEQKRKEELRNSKTTDKEKKKKVFRWPRNVKGKAKKEQAKGKHLVLVLRNNRQAEFQWVKGEGGLDQYGKYDFCKFDASAMYQYKKHNFLVVPEWRLEPVGGDVEELELKCIQEGKLWGGENDITQADKLKIGTSGQQTIIRAIEKAEVDRGEKKKGNWGWLIWVGVAIVAGYLILKLTGVIN